MNVTTQAALAAEYKAREWYHGLAEYGREFSDAKCQTEYLFYSWILVGQLRFLKEKTHPKRFISQTQTQFLYFRKEEKRFDLGERKHGADC